MPCAERSSPNKGFQPVPAVAMRQARLGKPCYEIALTQNAAPCSAKRKCSASRAYHRCAKQCHGSNLGGFSESCQRGNATRRAISNVQNKEATRTAHIKRSKQCHGANLG